MTSHNIEHIRRTLDPVFEKYGNRIIFAYLFGSAGQEMTDKSSDIDIAVFFTGNEKESFFEDKLSLYGDLCRALKRNDIDLVVLNTTHNLVLLDEITRSGTVIHDTNADFREDFELRVQHRAIDFREQRLANMGI